MRTIASISMLIVGALVFPAVTAGTPAAPELTDADDGAPSPAEVLSGWWATERADRVTFTVKVEDLGAAQPLADTNAAETRWYYVLTFSTSAWTTPVVVRCMISLVETSAAVEGTTPSGDWGGTVGTECVTMTRDITRGNVEVFSSFARVDVLGDTVTFVVQENRPGTPIVDYVVGCVNGAGTCPRQPAYVPLTPGTTFTQVKVNTYGGKVTTIGSPHYDTLYDVSGPGTSFTHV